MSALLRLWPLALALLLLALLAIREVARVSSGPRWRTLARNLLFVIIPLLLVFFATVVVRIMAVVR